MQGGRSKGHRAARRQRFLEDAEEIHETRRLARQTAWRENSGPRRHLSHWDNLLEEMKWMADDFRQESRWKAKKAKIYSRRCARVALEGTDGDKHRDAEEERTRRRECGKIAREIQKFWWKAKKVMQFKIQKRIEAKKRSMLDRHLHFLVSQTERYSTLLAKNLTSGDAPQKRSRGDVTDEMDSDDLEDEMQFEEDAEEQLRSAGAEEEVAELNDEAEMTLEELMRKYKLSVGEGCVIERDSGASEERSAPPSPEKHIQKRRRVSGGDPVQLQTEIPFLLKHELRAYQHLGLDWLVTLHRKRINGILADEMGLGKTIQTIALLAWLAVNEGSWGPHLIVVPTSVMLNWEMEFKKWCPAFKLLTYYGSAKQRKMKRQGWSKANSFHVCITSYALVLQDSPIFKRKKWSYLILDEAHMIKNWKSQRWQTLLKFNSKGRLLLTGTPLQNDVMELWSLMHFLMPHVFSSHAHFKNWFCNPLNEMAAEKGQPTTGNHQEVVPRLHGVLRPFILRRLKSEVEQQLPQKHEHVVYCSMSKRQKKLYEEYMASAETRSTLASKNFMGIINVLMQLRKVCNHPDLFEGRPIVSPFDVKAIDVQLPSLLSRLPPSFPPLPFSLHLARSQRGTREVDVASMVSLEALLQVGMQRDVEKAEAERRECLVDVQETELMHDRRAMEAIGLSMQSVHQRRLQHRAERLQFLHTLSTRRCTDCAFQPLPEFLHSLTPPWYADLVHDWVRSYADRASDFQSCIQTFMCFIPKARSPPPACWFSYPDWSVVTKAKQLALQQRREYESRNAILWSALARSRLYFPDRRLVQFDCGKLQTLALLLQRLHSDQHRVLIFTQMSRVLDVLEEFLNIHGYRYLRLDGSTKADARQALMQRFNHDPKIFVFILSTRSGGVGVNLTGADTVIFYDSDWNPAMDKQAQDRCHRIGQTREVNIYRLVTRFTIEENILKKSEEKRQLDFLAIQSGEFNLQFLQRLNPSELMDDAIGAGMSAEEVKKAMRCAEDETDAEAAKIVEQETAAELAEFNQEQHLATETDSNDEETEPPAGDKDPPEEEAASDSSTDSDNDPEETLEDADIEALLESCSAVERYAVRCMEQMSPAVDVELSAALELDGLNEDEWELQKLEEMKELNEEDIDKEAFRIVDWDRGRGKEVYQRQSEALQERLEIERRLFLEAEQRKHHEYLRRLTAQQNSHDLAATMPSGKKTAVAAKEKVEAMWEALWPMANVPLPWSNQEDLVVCCLSEAFLHGIAQSALTAVGQERLTFPNGIGAAIALVFHKMSQTPGEPFFRRTGDACKERLRALAATEDEESRLASAAATCRRLCDQAAEEMLQTTRLPALAALGEKLLALQSSLPDSDRKTPPPAAVAIPLAGMTRLTNAVRGATLQTELVALLRRVYAATADVGANCVGEEHFVLSFALQGYRMMQERLLDAVRSENAVWSTVVSRPFVSSVSHGRPWAATARPLHPPVVGQQLRPSLLSSSVAERPPATRSEEVSRAVMNAPSLLVNREVLRSYLEPPQPRPRKDAQQPRPMTFLVPLSVATQMIDREAVTTRPMIALSIREAPAPSRRVKPDGPRPAKQK